MKIDFKNKIITFDRTPDRGTDIHVTYTNEEVTVHMNPITSLVQLSMCFIWPILFFIFVYTVNKLIPNDPDIFLAILILLSICMASNNLKKYQESIYKKYRKYLEIPNPDDGI